MFTVSFSFLDHMPDSAKTLRLSKKTKKNKQPLEASTLITAYDTNDIILTEQSLSNLVDVVWCIQMCKQTLK